MSRRAGVVLPTVLFVLALLLALAAAAAPLVTEEFRAARGTWGAARADALARSLLERAVAGWDTTLASSLVLWSPHRLAGDSTPAVAGMAEAVLVPGGRVFLTGIAEARGLDGLPVAARRRGAWFRLGPDGRLEPLPGGRLSR